MEERKKSKDERDDSVGGTTSTVLRSYWDLRKASKERRTVYVEDLDRLLTVKEAGEFLGFPPEKAAEIIEGHRIIRQLPGVRVKRRTVGEKMGSMELNLWSLGFDKLKPIEQREAYDHHNYRVRDLVTFAEGKAGNRLFL